MIKSILKYAGKYKILTVVATVMVVIAVAAQILPYIFAYQIISPLIAGESITWQFAVGRVVGVAVCLVLNFVFYLGGLSLSHIAAFNTLYNLRVSLQGKMEKLPLGVVQEKGTGNLKKLFVDDVESMELLLAHAIPEGIGNLLIPIGVFIAMFAIDWKLALLTLIMLPIGVWAVMMMTRSGFAKMDSYYRSAQVMNNTIIEYINGMEVVKVFGRDGDSYKRYKKDVEAYRDFTLDWYRVCWPWMAVYAGVFACCSLFTLPFGGMFVVNGWSQLADLILVLCLSFGLGGPLMKAMRFVPSLAQVDRKVKELEKTLDAEPLKSKNGAFTGNGNTAVFENVTFAYEDKDVIQDACLVVQEGKKTALVGESGSGKSTLAKLLVHYYDIGSGKITLGGQDITDMSLDALNARISFVSQDNFLFNTSIYDNIKVGKPDATKEEVLAAAQKAQCMEFINRLENGIYTLAGDCGSALSGGERQRVSLARAILKNAPVVILDEATAFADPENEEKMEKAIAEVVRGKTLLVIAHRLASIQNADKIYVLDNGRVAGSGTHKELLESNDIYKRLWQISEDSAAWNVVGTTGGAV